MTVLTIGINYFQKSIVDKNRGSIYFESKDRIVALLGNAAIVQAFKKTSDKIVKDAIPLAAIGYPGISTVECKRLDVDLATEIYKDFEALAPEEQAKILKELSTPKEQTVEE